MLPGRLRRFPRAPLPLPGSLDLSLIGERLLTRCHALIALVVVSLATEKPDEEVVRNLTWSPALLAEEAPALARLAWYKNYRYQSAAMLVLIAIFVIAWW